MERASRERASEGPSSFLCPSRLRCSLARSRKTCLTCPNRRACSQASDGVVRGGGGAPDSKQVIDVGFEEYNPFPYVTDDNQANLLPCASKYHEL